MPPSTRSPQPIAAVLALRDVRRRALAQHLGVSEHYLGRVINGREMPSPEFAERCADALDTPVDKLFCADPSSVVVEFVQRTTSASGVPEQLEDAPTAAEIATILGGAS